MNILNKLNQADRKKIEKKLKKLYRNSFDEINRIGKEVENEDDIEHRDIMWEDALREMNRINGMKEVMDILGIDYSDWRGKI